MAQGAFLKFIISSRSPEIAFSDSYVSLFRSILFIGSFLLV